MVAHALWRSEALRVGGLAMAMFLPMASAESATKAQPCVPLISAMHEQPFLIPLIWYTDL